MLKNASRLLCLLLLVMGLLTVVDVPAQAQGLARAPHRGQVVSTPARPLPPHLWSASTSGLPLACQAPGASTPCYTPNQIQRAYAVSPLLSAGVDGSGQTIVIVDDSADPSLAQDLHTFDQAFGLPDPVLSIQAVGCSLAPTWACQPGTPGTANPGVAVEISLDVEWAHALAPKANILLLLVNDDAAQTAEQILEFYIAGANYAIAHGLGEVIALSVGFAEACSPPDFLIFEHNALLSAIRAHITVAAGTGDMGSTQYTCDTSSFFTTPTVAIPASDPGVLAVGGTHLQADTNGNYQGETAWTQVSAQQNNGATGGGFSTLYGRPDYQRGVLGTRRGIPDVSVNADNNSGYTVECSYCNGGTPVFFSLGGTSFGGPVWAGLIALADQLAGRSLGFVNPALYAIAAGPQGRLAFHDIIQGNNQYAFVNANGQPVTVPGYSAVSGWDAATGLGTPNAEVLLPLLARQA